MAEQRKVPVVMYDYYDSCRFPLNIPCVLFKFKLAFFVFPFLKQHVVLACFTNRFQLMFATFASQATVKISALRIQVGVAMKTDRKAGERLMDVVIAAPLVASSHCSRHFSVSFCRVSQVLYS